MACRRLNTKPKTCDISVWHKQQQILIHSHRSHYFRPTSPILSLIFSRRHHVLRNVVIHIPNHMIWEGRRTQPKFSATYSFKSHTGYTWSSHIFQGKSLQPNDHNTLLPASCGSFFTAVIASFKNLRKSSEWWPPLLRLFNKTSAESYNVASEECCFSLYVSHSHFLCLFNLPSSSDWTYST
jgi:hypothetical protein